MLKRKLFINYVFLLLNKIIDFYSIIQDFKKVGGSNFIFVESNIDNLSHFLNRGNIILTYIIIIIILNLIIIIMRYNGIQRGYLCSLSHKSHMRTGGR